MFSEFICDFECLFWITFWFQRIIFSVLYDFYKSKSDTCESEFLAALLKIKYKPKLVLNFKCSGIKVKRVSVIY